VILGPLATAFGYRSAFGAASLAALVGVAWLVGTGSRLTTPRTAPVPAVI